jgi:Cdc6-like AAA superfamily ATPase
MLLDQQKAFQLSMEVGTVFTPTAPIDEKTLFAGRIEQIGKIMDALNQKGQHAVVYGERGVGKTSLSNVLASFLPKSGSTVLSPRINCDATDTFETLWVKIMKEIQFTQTKQLSGFGANTRQTQIDAATLFGDEQVSPDSVRRALTLLSLNTIPILIVDEFDRVAQDVRRAMADTIKTLSDHAVAATIVIVGVADSLDQLINEHESIERAIVQIPMPRMSVGEIKQIITLGLERLGMTVESKVLDRICVLSQGLPHYAHLIGLNSARTALEGLDSNITESALSVAITKAIDSAQQSIRTAYHNAIRSARKDNLFASVLLACALAKTDELGEFAAQDVRGPIRKITGKEYDIPSFAQHLNDFSEEKRGAILRKSGHKRKFRYKFANPLMQPYVIMQGYNSGLINLEQSDED